MPTIGESLREARMRHRIDIAEVEAKTKIRAKYLRALENEEFEMLPGSTFVRSFLRTYAEFLGLDAQLLLEEYRVRHEPPSDAELQPFSQPSPPPRDRRPTPRPPAAVLAVLGLVLVLGVLAVIGLVGGGDDGGEESARTTATERTSEPTRAERRRERARERRRRARERRRRAAATERVRLRIVPQDATYVCIDNGDGRVVFEGTLTDARTFSGRRLRLNLGKRSAAVRVNGREVELEPGPTPAGFDFNRGRQTELAADERPC